MAEKTKEMTKEEHKKRHEILHHGLDELMADMIDQTCAMPSTTTVMELMQWSHEQTKKPTNRRIDV